MLPLLTAREAREVDRWAIDDLCIPELILMEHAALGVLSSLERRYAGELSKTRGVLICGPGNNGGDALAVARLAHERGCKNLIVVLVGDETTLTDSAAVQLKILGKLSIPWTKEISLDVLEASDWIVDGLFGTGLSRIVDGHAKQVIETMNEVAGRRWIVSIDIPSGLSGDTGNPLGVAVRASETVALGFLKRGLMTGMAADYVGKVTLAPIQIPRALRIPILTFSYAEEDAARIPRRRPASHKGDNGHVHVWAGEAEKEGAAGIAAVGALRAGAGLVTLMGDTPTLTNVRPRLPLEVMTTVYNGKFETKPKGSVFVFGPGMGTGESAKTILEAALGIPAPVIFDADALNVFAIGGAATKLKLATREKSGHATIFTPHPKEAGRLLGTTTDDVERDRYAAAKKISEEWHATVLLKGKGTVIASTQGPTIVVNSGDTGLSKGGTGDLLTGVIAALIAQGIAEGQAVPLASYLHGRASELLSQRYGHERSSLATEIASFIPLVLEEVENGSRRKKSSAS